MQNAVEVVVKAAVVEVVVEMVGRIVHVVFVRRLGSTASVE
jgi:hypothetical protein